ncbi:MAG: hypothetical protein WD598_12220 [Acidimicrobiia bacterium]
MSEDDSAHYQALDELHLHGLVRQRHADVRYEVGGVGPDFRIYEADVCVAAIEVLSLFQQQDWTDEQLRHARLADAVCRAIAPTAGYFVNFQIEAADREPAPRKYIAHLRREIDSLPPHEQVAEEMASGERGDPPSAMFQDDGLDIATRFLPMRRDAPSKTDPGARIVGMGPAIGGFVATARRLRDRVEAKAGSRYDVGGIPFLVAVGMHDFVGDDDQAIDGLYGGEAIDLRTHEAVRQTDGVFGLDRTTGVGRHRRVAGVVVVSGMRPWVPGGEDVAMFRNPFAEVPWPDGWLPLTREFGSVSETAEGVQLGWRSEERSEAS